MKTSIRPSSYFDPVRELRTLKSESEAKEKGIDTEDQFIGDMGMTKGWKILDEFIDRIKDDLDKSVRLLMEQGASREVIGDRTIVKELCKEVLDRVQNKVYDAVESISGK